MQNSQLHYSFTMCKAVYAVIWCSGLGEVCHTSITYENEAIYVHFQFCYCCSCSPNDFMLLLFSIYNYTWTTRTNRTRTNNNENKKTHINYRAYMP